MLFYFSCYHAHIEWHQIRRKCLQTISRKLWKFWFGEKPRDFSYDNWWDCELKISHPFWFKDKSRLKVPKQLLLFFYRTGWLIRLQCFPQSLLTVFVDCEWHSCFDKTTCAVRRVRPTASWWLGWMWQQQLFFCFHVLLLSSIRRFYFASCSVNQKYIKLLPLLNKLRSLHSEYSLIFIILKF